MLLWNLYDFCWGNVLRRRARFLVNGDCLRFVTWGSIYAVEDTVPQQRFQDMVIILIGGPRGRVVKVADFSALDHSIISPMWVRASLGARVTCGTSQVLLAGVSGGFSPGTPVFASPTD